ncbi:hypothetical protein N6P31_07545 [Pectobacterium betavasculorum]|uniref:Uncharacterized protein n=1 Tax=Pectobacterium betavasculorum TaxID=55207 RepID=A0ABR4V2Z8_9GAMM|nr:hypothetical protein [Pectobacterium betavasculorum]KFX21748.1 hypothetical protein JV35_00890 [Pectobacterium betavasculorum]
MNDVIIIGGSVAGLAERSPFSTPACRAIASPATRMACSVTITSHRWISAEARQQPVRYPSIRLVSAQAESVSGTIDDFSVLTDDGGSLRTRRPQQQSLSTSLHSPATYWR